MTVQHNYETKKQVEQIPQTGVDESLEDNPPSRKLGIALVGLGKYSTEQLAPALQQTTHCYLAGIVTGTSSKIPEWKKKYEIPNGNIYNYENFDEIRDNESIDIIYVVLPNALHAEFVIRAAKAGKHVICEKPMAVSVDECDRMIEACNQTGKLLSIGYRLHFDPYHREVMKWGQAESFGKLAEISARHGSSETDGWRIEKSLAGGGPLMDLGIYCIQAARYTTGTEPLAVMAVKGETTQPEKFKNIEESLQWEMEFPGNIKARCESSYTADMDLLHANASHGWFELSPAYSYNGLKGKTATGFVDLPDVNQQALQMDDFALSILTGKPVTVPGEMGRTDMIIIEAIYESMNTGKKVTLQQPTLAGTL